MPHVFAFSISVMAGIVSYYICKWLDREKDLNGEQPEE